ncbi:MAG: gliding motility-associated C-terminal domain-containing protein [Bacteroidota bacterium]
MHQLKLTLVILLWISLISNGTSQNLVPNPSFEQYDTCPYSMGRINDAVPWAQPLPFSTTDYFNTCTSDYTLIHFFNNIVARTGHAYAGMSPYDNSTWREYIEVKMNDSLMPNKQYCVSYFIRLLYISTFAIDRLGMLLTDTMVTKIDVHSPILFTPQVESPEWVFYQDTNNWERVQGSFTANGSEKWLTIGNFHLDNDTHTVIAGNHGSYFAYYLIDDVAVYPCDAPVYTANAGGNKEICKNQSITLGTVYNSEYLYWWYNQNKILIDSTAQITVTPAQTTTYYLKVKDFKFDESWDSVTVTVNEFCNNMVYIPNIFSPNKDGANDVFRVRGPEIDSAHLQVYNRWGNMVFESKDVYEGWDGTFKGKDCEAGVYYYWAEVTFKNGEKVVKKGDVSLVK